MLKPDDYQRNQRVLDLVQIYLASQRGSSATRPNANELIRFQRKAKNFGARYRFNQYLRGRGLHAFGTARKNITNIRE